jgi:hypothetical protein
MKIEALPIGLKFSIAGVNFTTNVQYDIYGEVSIFIFDKELNTVAELNKNNAENVKNVLTNFILKNYDLYISDERDIKTRVKKLVDNLSNEIKTYNKAKVKPMAKTTKKPTAKQLAARKKFAAMAKAKAKAAKAKKFPAKKKAPTKKVAAKKATSAYQTGSSNKLYDSMRKAQGPGKRVSATGGVYYERRKNRSDMPGSILGIGALKKSAISECTNKLGTLHAKKLMEPTKRGKAKLQKEITAVNKKIKHLGKL